MLRLGVHTNVNVHGMCMCFNQVVSLGTI
jgi:hypothetical protein